MWVRQGHPRRGHSSDQPHVLLRDQNRGCRALESSQDQVLGPRASTSPYPTGPYLLHLGPAECHWGMGHRWTLSLPPLLAAGLGRPEQRRPSL